MTNEQCTNVAETAWNLANEPDTDFAASVALRDCAVTIKELQSRIEALEKDAARLDWLESSKEMHAFCHTGYDEYRYYAHQADGFQSVRDTIDTAMQKD